MPKHYLVQTWETQTKELVNIIGDEIEIDYTQTKVYEPQ
jgi:hypothetical protein